MTTRLDRLLLLLDTGSTPSVRVTAARQLGQIAAQTIQHASALAATSAPSATSINIPDWRGIDGEWNEIVNLLSRVLPYLRSKNWETRLAAGEAVESIAKAVGVWDPSVSETDTSDQLQSPVDSKPTNLVTPDAKSATNRVGLRFDTFDLDAVLREGTILLSSAGKEFDYRSSHPRSHETLMAAKRDVASKLGLGLGCFGGLDMDSVGMDVNKELEDSTNGSTLVQSPVAVSHSPPPTDADERSPLHPSVSVPPTSQLPFSNPLNSERPCTHPDTHGQQYISTHSPSFTDEDALTTQSTPTTTLIPLPATATPSAETSEPNLEGLSARERNAMKRKRKAFGKGNVSAASSGSISSALPAFTNNTSSTLQNGAIPTSGPAKLRIIEQAGSLPGESPSRIAVPALPLTNTELQADHPSSTLPSIELSKENVVIIDPGAKAKARAAAESAKQAGGGEVNTPASTMQSDHRLQYIEGEWPFSSFVEVLMIDMFSSQWEFRHGAALGLIPLLKIQGFGAGKHVGVTRALNHHHHQVWMEDLGLRLICMLCLDRFGDYVGDQVVAPVRETGAQGISLVAKWLDRDRLERILEVLSGMVEQKNAKSPGQRGYVWQVRHAGLIGMKYLIAVKINDLRDNFKLDFMGPTQAACLKSDDEESKPVLTRNPEDPDETIMKLDDPSSDQVIADPPVSTSQQASSPPAFPNLLSIITKSSLIGLRDHDDDVRAAASGALLPVTDLIVKGLPTMLAELLDVLWDALGSSKDDLSSSVGNIMDLLANLITYPSVLTQLSSFAGRSLPTLIPRLFPFFRHTISSVRLSVVKALAVFLRMPDLDLGSWIDEKVLCLMYQNMLVEERPDIRSLSNQLWNAMIDELVEKPETTQMLIEIVRLHIAGWFQLVTTPRTKKLDATLFFTAIPNSKYTAAQDLHLIHNVDKSIMAQDLSLVSIDDIMRGRLAAAKALGHLMSKLTRLDQLQLFTEAILTALDSEFALPRMISAIMLEDWALDYAHAPSGEVSEVNLGQIEAIQPISNKLRSSTLFTGPSITYAELESYLAGIKKDSEGLFATFASLGKVPAEKIPKLPACDFTIESALKVVNQDYPALIPLVGRGSKKMAIASLEDRRRKLQDVIGMYEKDRVIFDTQLDATVASAVVALREIPGKISPLIKGLTQSIKNETIIDLQTRSANALASFVDICTSPNSPVKNDPTDKIIGNLSTYLCQDESQTPTFVKGKASKRGIFLAQDNGIRPSTGASDSGLTSEASSDEASSQAKLLRRGAELALSSLAAKFGDDLIDRIPKLWNCMSEPLLTLFNTGDVEAADQRMENEPAQPKLGQDLLDCLTVLPAVASSLPLSSHPRLATLFAPLCQATRSKFSVVRYSAVKCYAALCSFLPDEGLHEVVTRVLPLIADPLNLAHRRGAIEMVSRLVEVLNIKILAYIIFLIVPVLGRMSDTDDDVRYVATHTFACLIKLMPLELGVPDPPGFSQEMLEKRQSERTFLSQLLGGSKIEQYEIPVDIKADLRKYQREGISWLAFLAKYQLHGVLCDDMGLGKTLQSICILASKHHERAELHKQTKSLDTVHLPSLVVCPPTLTGHWAHEIKTYASKLKPLLYVGGPQERSSLVKKIKKHDVVIMSYDIVRNDIEQLSKVSWNYCILDEGHIIKNAKSKLSKAVKMLKANHRLILSGTPIQNNALELWSLFDFLMPGFLGTEKYFNERFGRPISMSRDAKSSTKEQEAGALALEALHKQVLPFLLRRLKEDVLDDLPPKIIQDYYCELSALQKQLYEDFSKSRAKDEAEGLVKKSKNAANGQDPSSQHVFQALQYLKKLVNHPAMVIRPEVPQHQAIINKLGSKGYRDISHAPKLLALRQILRDCGIGLTTATTLIETVTEDGAGTTTSGGTIPQHRVLIFCQMREMLDIIEHDLFKNHMPTVTFMRMDGTTEASKRHDIVQTFNADPSIDCLLLTTHVGGLGLNLTGADTVIFVEHDWNPMKDLQAMDRAHRLGQKKVVNVYRLITRATLEEKIMGLQRFKLNIATSIVNQQNSNLASLDTDQILDLFAISESKPESTITSTTNNSTGLEGSGLKKNLLDGLEALPPESEYESLDPAKFVASL
ncbi:uncharacterized protein MELLADRAFT_116969 [Melampsora larici-populina 98AG31]|uniref:TATA-binding protein-associated factor mot1 n=1 Tax=Melampsora larici-populina (strain 98AG31 / pathotype 3-4-7) TaxID=747676 RepID=F4RRW4_MELLP|nr:uncharacterized protein MELLADRAFT_116969 [Melampsora larici-populina 98AG31]EGG04881.1 hypothetical protein MELLADRAFT_116969 [Melampsora larici-populina 98AG31]